MKIFFVACNFSNLVHFIELL